MVPPSYTGAWQSILELIDCCYAHRTHPPDSSVPPRPKGQDVADKVSVTWVTHSPAPHAVTVGCSHPHTITSPYSSCPSAGDTWGPVQTFVSSTTLPPPPPQYPLPPTHPLALLVGPTRVYYRKYLLPRVDVVDIFTRLIICAFLPVSVRIPVDLSAFDFEVPQSDLFYPSDRENTGVAILMFLYSCSLTRISGH